MADKDVKVDLESPDLAHADPEKSPLEAVEGVVVTLTKEDVRLTPGSSSKELAKTPI